MTTKLLGGTVFKILICSSKTEDEALEWARANLPAPGLNIKWKLCDKESGYPKGCNCKGVSPNNSNQHYIFSVFD